MDNIIKRLYSRQPSHLSARLTFNGATYRGVIEDVSEVGMGYLITTSFEAAQEITPKKTVMLDFQLPTGVPINVTCEIVWTSAKLFNEEKLTVGMKIFDAPREYREWVKSQSSGS
ncbi:MAG: PilZ domain-containing protein [Nitrospiraceae bacterium]|nr:MAG: PilZ domain-containing protein [Nitrospiraceae bacterium]